MKKIKYAITIVLVLVILLLVNKFNVLKGFSPTEIKNYVVSFGIYASIVYIILFAVVPLTLFPDSILAIAGGMIFGLVGGFICTMIGALCGGTVAFFLARYLGRDVLKAFFTKKINLAESKIEKNGFMVIFLLRLIPLFPFDVISYSAGLSKVKYKDFMLATAIGTIPGIFVFTNIGDKSLELGSHSFYYSLALLVLLFVGSFLLKKKISIKEFE